MEHHPALQTKETEKSQSAALFAIDLACNLLFAYLVGISVFTAWSHVLALCPLLTDVACSNCLYGILCA
jgi:hypothetical protein